MATLAETLQALLRGWQAHSQQMNAPQRTPAQSGSFDAGKGSWQDPSYTGATAMSRFTRDPIHILPASQDPDGDNPVDQVGGSTIPRNIPGKGPETDIYAYTQPSASYADLQQVLTHEQVHALLGGMPDQGKELPYSMPDRTDPLVDSFYRAHRMGNASTEIPAYLGAFKQGQLPGISASDATAWNQEFLKGLPAPIAALLSRIISSQRNQSEDSTPPRR